MNVVCQSVSEAIQKVLNAVSKRQNENYFVYRRDRREDVTKLCSDLKSLFDWNFDFQQFYRNLCDIQQLSLEMLWNFHIFQIMSLDTYLFNMESQLSLQSFEKSMTTFCLQSCNDDWSLFFVQTGMLSYIIARAFPVSHENISEVEIKQICESITKSLLDSVFSMEEKEMTSERMKPFFALWTCGTLVADSLHSFCCFALHIFLNKPKATETDAFIVQENWRTKADPFHLLTVIEKFIKTMKPDKVEHILSQALWKEDTNWKNFIVAVASISGSTEENPLAKKIAVLLIKDGFDQLNPKSLQRAFLIGRQTCLKPNTSFASAYGLWLQSNIGDNIQARNPQAVSLLLQVLSDMIPYEKNIDCIKVFLERPIMVPYECQSLLSDYIALLKTRAKDLQPLVNTKKILEKVLNTFQETGKIPPYILEASLMHKHHYLNEFLPVLLTPRVIPSVPDVRERFIDLLNKSGKIPSCVFQRYKLSCQQEQQNLLAGINMVDDNFVEFMDEDVQIIN